MVKYILQILTQKKVPDNYQIKALMHGNPKISLLKISVITVEHLLIITDNVDF